MKYKTCYFEFSGELSSIRSEVEGVIGLQLLERESSYWGGVYFLYEDVDAEVEIRVFRNVDHRGDWIKQNLGGSEFLCDVNGPIDIVNTLAVKVEEGTQGRLVESRVIEVEEE